MDISLIIPAFIAGILTFLAPCTFPLLPGYLAYISGASAANAEDPKKAKFVRRRILVSGALYVAGFSLVFIIFGAVAGIVGQTLALYRIWLTRIGGVLVIIFGLFMMGLLNLPFLSRKFQVGATNLLGGHRPRNAFLLGAAFALGWTPCVGPILGSILFLASTSQTVLAGTFLLFIFSLGLALPFLAIALGMSSASKFIAKISRHLNIISLIGGAFLVGLGILLFLNRTDILISYSYRLLRFINYERILDYL